MKKAVVIYNPNSGLDTIRKQKEKEGLSNDLALFAKYGYEVEVYQTKYPGHAREIVSQLEPVDLVISVGGDGTFNEAMTGNFKRKQRLTLSHLPYGTTNDIGTMFGLGKNPYKNIEAILSGKVIGIDIGTINDRPFVYVAGFGKFMNVAYETSREMKRKIGRLAYIIEGIKDFFRHQTPLYELSYETSGEKYHGLYSFALISNATRIAGINNFYKNIKLDDGKLEVLFCNLQKKKDIVRSLIYLKTNDITKVPGFYYHQTDHLKITFYDRLKKSWCLDGEEFNTPEHTFDIKVEKNVPMMIPDKALSKLFMLGDDPDELSTRNGKDHSPRAGESSNS